jgi:ABC-type nitrate/sulfonate/bicarbonate transport system substrate-binding protein
MRIAMLVLCAAAGLAGAQQWPVMGVAAGGDFGHLPKFVRVEKGLLKKHGVDVKRKVINIDRYC